MSNRNVRGAVWALIGALVGFVVANNVVYMLLRIEPGDRTDLLALAAITAVFAAVGFWWGRRS